VNKLGKPLELVFRISTSWLVDKGKKKKKAQTPNKNTHTQSSFSGLLALTGLEKIVFHL